MRLKHKSSKPRRRRGHASNGGFFLLEALAALVTALTALLAIGTVLIAYLERVKTDQAAAEIESLGSRMAAAITDATKTASLWAIYPDREIYLADPLNNGGFNAGPAPKAASLISGSFVFAVPAGY
jgi:hypothetical protein